MTMQASADDVLIARVGERAKDPRMSTDAYEWSTPMVHPVVAPGTLEEAESRLGFKLPILLRRLYLEVGNGGFGPSYGLLGISGGAHRNWAEIFSSHPPLAKRIRVLEGHAA